MIPVLWICGPPGVGKTAVAWNVYRRLTDNTAQPAYVDVDQLGMCYPARSDDPDRHALKTRNVSALRGSFAASGARMLIVSGVADARRGPDLEALGGPPVRVVRLRADAAELRRRLLERQGSSAQVDAAVEEASALDASTFADWCIDTRRLSIGQATTRVLERLRDWPLSISSHPLPPDNDAHAGGELLWVSGPTGIGKSTVGFRAWLDVLALGECAAYLDIDQIGFCGTAPDDPALRARNLAAVWRNFHAAGARRAIVVGQLRAGFEQRLYEQALPSTTVSWCRLRAGDAELANRILSRGDGGSWAQPGDPLKSRPHDHLLAVAAAASEESRALDQHGVGVSVDVGDLGVEDAAAALLKVAGWRAGTPG